MRARGRLLLERGPVEVFLPVLTARAVGQEPVEGADRLTEFRRGGREAAFGHWTEGLAGAERLAAEAGEIGSDCRGRHESEGERGSERGNVA